MTAASSITSIVSKTPITPVIRGHIDLFQSREHNEAQLDGWIFRDDTPIERIDVALQGAPWISGVRLHERPDVEAAFAPVIGSRPHVVASGFGVLAPLPTGVEASPKTIVEITPYTPAGLRLDSFRTHFFSLEEELKERPQPPPELQDRVGGTKDFVSVGAHAASLILTYVGKYKSICDAKRILDWGCGCARVITQMAKFVSSEHLYGCDIDSAAIEWDKENIPGPTFTRVEPYPPTTYGDDFFDIVYGISVMTHLDERAQLEWLSELKRITCPGAILALSIMGEKLRLTNMPASLAQTFAEKGFASFVPNYSDMLTEFSHRGYYQEAYHTLDYVEETWGRYFDVLEYVETKFQDIVVLRAS